MEDWNMLAADCAVISCCCQCLILQIIVFTLLKLPYKLFQKTKEYAKKMLTHRRREGSTTNTETHQYRDNLIEIDGGSSRIQLEGEFLNNGSHGCGCCMEEVERALEEYSQKGDFAFGSFWGRGESAKQDFKNRVVQYHMIEMIGPFSYALT